MAHPGRPSRSRHRQRACRRMERSRATMSLGPPAGPVTKALCGTLLIASVLFAITERKLGFGITDLTYSVTGVLGMELWRLVTYPFVEGSTFPLLLSILFLYLFGR